MGAKVVVADIQRDLLEQTVAQLVSRGDVIGVPTDVTDPRSVEALATETYVVFGACNVLCNNAGVGAPPPSCGRPRSTTGSGSTRST